MREIKHNYNRANGQRELNTSLSQDHEFIDIPGPYEMPSTYSKPKINNVPLERPHYYHEPVQEVAILEARTFALIGGLLMLLFGTVSFLVPGTAEGLPELTLQNSYGLFAGYFPMNVVNKIALVAFGIAGVMSCGDILKAVKWSKWVFGCMSILAILGVFTQTNTIFGYWPLFGGEVYAHTLFSILGAYFGYRVTTKYTV